MPDTPASVADVDAAWLSEVLGPDVTVSDVSVSPMPGMSFLGELAQVQATHDAGAGVPSSFVLKLPSTDPGSRQVGELLGIWWRETQFYAELADEVGIAVPRCYFNGSDREADRYALLLGDLAPAEKGDQVTGATRDQAERTTDALAALHAKWWNVARPTFPDWMPGIDQSPGAPMLLAAIEGAQPAFRSRWGDVVAPRTLDWLANGLGRLGEELTAMAQGELTLAHADVHLNNLFFGTGADATVWLIDWQTAMRTHGVTDLTFFLCTNLSVDDRQQMEGDLLERYRLGLAERGVTLDASDLQRLHRVSVFWWMAMLSNNLATIEPADAAGRALFEAIITRCFAAGVDLNIGELAG
jgi:hypothetical protein